MRKAKKLGQLNFRDYFSTITMSFTESITAAMMGGGKRRRPNSARVYRALADLSISDVDGKLLKVIMK